MQKTDFNALLTEVQYITGRIRRIARARGEEMQVKHAETLEQNAFSAYRNRNAEYLLANLQTLSDMEAELKAEH